MRRKILVFCMALCVLCTGCGNTDMRDTSTADSDITENVFDENSADEAASSTDSNVISSVGAEIIDGVADYTYDGEDVVLKYRYTVNNADSLGLVVLCDGIPVEFALDKADKKNIYNKVQVTSDGSNNDIDIYFTPIGNTGDEVAVSIIDVTDGDIDIEAVDKQKLMDMITIEMRNKAFRLSGIKVYMDKDGLAIDEGDISETYENKTISEADVNGVLKNSNLDMVISESDINGEMPSYIEVSKGEKVDINIKLYGGDGINLTSTFLVDDDVYPAFDGKKYQRCYVDKNNFTIFKATIDTSDLSVGRHMCFSVCDGEQYSSVMPAPAFIIEVTE